MPDKITPKQLIATATNLSAHGFTDEFLSRLHHSGRSSATRINSYFQNHAVLRGANLAFSKRLIFVESAMKAGRADFNSMIEEALVEYPIRDVGWTHDELKACVVAYIDILKKERAGERPTKKEYFKSLSGQFIGRSEKAFEYRMQNISYVLSVLGRDWIKGLKPARNVGPAIASQIEEILADIENRPASRTIADEIEIRDYLVKQKLVEKPQGNKQPKQSVSRQTQYERNGNVRIWLLQKASGICERCESCAPFKTAEGLPYLEIHHVRRLADGGSDTVGNAVALCPNCHREIHYGVNRASIADDLYSRIARLIRE